MIIDKLNKALKVLLFLIPLTIGISIGHVLVYWALDRDPPSIIYTNELSTKTAKPGGVVSQRLYVDRKRQCETWVFRTIYDSSDERFALTPLYLKVAGPKGQDKYSQEIRIPEGVDLGPARLEIEVHWICNPIHNYFPIVGQKATFQLDIVE